MTTTQQLPQTHPNNLKKLAKARGFTIQEIHTESGIPSTTLYRWADGRYVIPHAEREILARIIGCEVDELAPIYKEQQPGHTIAGEASPMADADEGKIVIGTMYGKTMYKEGFTMPSTHNLDTLASPKASALMQQADVDCFAVDDLIVLTQSPDWRGWNADDIRITTLPTPLQVPADIEAVRQEKLPAIQRNYVNSSHWRLAGFTPAFSDRRYLEITLAPLGFHDFYTLMPYLDEPLLPGETEKVSIREKYGYSAFTYASPEDCCRIPAPVSLQGILVTSDHQLVLMQRSNSVAFYPSHWSASFEETMDAPGLSPKKTMRPGDTDFFACAVRGLEEEFGIPAQAIESIKVLSLNLEYLILAVGAVTVIATSLTAQEVKSHWLLSAPDKNEASKLATVSTELPAIMEKMFSGTLWHPTSRMRLLQFLFHTYGVKEVVSAFAQRL